MQTMKKLTKSHVLDKKCNRWRCFRKNFNRIPNQNSLQKLKSLSY